MKKIIITGATSMIGAALIDTVLKDDNVNVVYAVVRPNTINKSRIVNDDRIKIVECDVFDLVRLPDLIRDNCDVFFHLAWPRTLTYHESYDDVLLKCSSVQHTLIALKSAYELGCRKFVGAGTQAEYGIIDSDLISPSTPCNPKTADGITHYAAGLLAKSQAESMNMDFAWVRIFSIYGKYDRSNSMISSTITKLIHSEYCSFTPCEQMWDYLSAKDVGRAFYMIGKHLKNSHIYCLGSGIARPLKEYVQIIRDIVAPDADLGIGDLPYPAKFAMRGGRADISDLKRDIGWEPQIDFKDGIIELYKHMK